MGHVQSNFSGSVYNLYDEQPTDREILATIAYESTLRLSEEPRNIEVYITHPEHKYYLLDGIDGKKNLKELYEIGDNASARKILKFINKKPRWNKQKKCFQMDFHGKMKIPSVKNMILVDV